MPTAPTSLSVAGMPVRLLGMLVAAVGALMVLAAPAFAALGSEVLAGRSVAAQLQNGSASCSTLSPTQFEHLGEYVMDRMVGSRAAHSAVNQRMSQALGGENTDRMHELMGRSFASCATGAGSGVPMGPGMMAGAGAGGSGWAAMMSASGWAWMHDGSWQHMSQADWQRLGHSMMGSGYLTDHHGWSTATVIAIVLGALALAALAAAAAARRPRRRPPAATSSA